ncbi:putative serine/threonine-protein kinase HSL1 [Nakaseomyces bracarensis]|uniref:Serine/threonine-protein kinase HSL1 n=1 Tax=Nakaseomyces bracarensis TaxID=273131 RepID=A0ABR4NVF3_9SACH
MSVLIPNQQMRASSVAKKAAWNAMNKTSMTGSNGNVKYVRKPEPPVHENTNANHLDRVIQSVNDATKRLSQADSTLSNNTKSSKRKSRDTVGPWKLGKTLGKGSSGRVRLAKNVETGQLAAIKIVPKKNYLRKNNKNDKNNANANDIKNTHTKGSSLNPYGIEREIVIMKLISHPNVMGLLEVWENKSELYLVLEYVDGGELFDYLVARGKLSEPEAVHYFKQIIQGVAYCHSFNISHRDLKPENLLLDKKNKIIKIADFGMAALELPNKLLETSCGSPHYASPEIVMGKPYHGGPSDVWSCGIILFALLTGHLPFNDDNIKKLLLKVQTGRYQLPHYLTSDAKDLISKILVLNPEKRLTINGILSHPLIMKYNNPPKHIRKLNLLGRGKSNSDLHLLENATPPIINLTTENDIDESILKSLQILWHGTSKEYLITRLLQKQDTEEKLFYSLLYQYKMKHSKPISHDKLQEKIDDIVLENVNDSTTSFSQQEQSSDDQANTGSRDDTAFTLEEPEFTINNSKATIEPPAPKLEQKSQFSLHSLKSKDGIPSSDLPPLPPTIPAFTASSSKMFTRSRSNVSIRSRKSGINSSDSKRSLVYSYSNLSAMSRSSSKKLTQEQQTGTLPMSPSVKTLHSIVSSKSIHKSISKKSLKHAQRRTLHNSESKRSLYSQTSISKRSLNLNDYLMNDAYDNNNAPPLPKLDSDDEFGLLCDQILNNNALDNILEVEEEEEAANQKDLEKEQSNETLKQNISITRESYITPKKEQQTFSNLTSTDQNRYSMFKKEEDASGMSIIQSQNVIIQPTFNFVNDENDNKVEFKENKGNSRDKIGSPLKDITNRIDRSVVVDKTNKKVNKDAIRTLSSPIETRNNEPSLDPRRNVSQPLQRNAFEALLKKSNSKSHLSNLVNTPREKKSKEQMRENSVSRKIPISNMHKTVTNSSSVLDETQTSALAQSSTIYQEPLLSMPSTLLNSSMTFKNLVDLLTDDDSDSMLQSKSKRNADPIRKQSTKITLSAGADLLKGLQTNGMRSNVTSMMSDGFEMTSDLSEVMEMPTNTQTAQVAYYNNYKEQSLDKNIFEIPVNHAIDLVNGNNKAQSEVNIFEDAPSDSTSLQTSSSEADSQTRIQRKAVSIETLNASNIVTPTTDVRVSMYGNANNNTNLPRESTAELISRFKLTPEKNNGQVQKRFSTATQNGHGRESIALSQSIISMFKDIDEDGKPVTKDFFDRIDESEIPDDQKHRVTMLFDEENNAQTQTVDGLGISGPKTEEIFNDSPIKVRVQKASTVFEVNPLKEAEEEDEIDDSTDEEDLQEEIVDNKDRLSVVKNEMPKAKKKEPEAKLTPPVKITSEKNVNTKTVKQETTQPKSNWFSKIFSGLMSGSHGGSKLSRSHVTKLSFEDTHLLTIKEFGSNGIDYQLKTLDKKGLRERVEYDCRFIKGNFKFRIKIIHVDADRGTMITVKKKGSGNSPSSIALFNKFNDDINNLIRNAEAKA